MNYDFWDVGEIVTTASSCIVEKLKIYHPNGNLSNFTGKTSLSSDGKYLQMTLSSEWGGDVQDFMKNMKFEKAEYDSKSPALYTTTEYHEYLRGVIPTNNIFGNWEISDYELHVGSKKEKTFISMIQWKHNAQDPVTGIMKGGTITTLWVWPPK